MALAEDLQDIPLEHSWPLAMILWAMVSSRLRLADRAGELYEILAPFSDRLAGNPASVFGTVAWALGTLAATLEHQERALEHFAAAAEIEQRARRAPVPRPHPRQLGANAHRPRPLRGPPPRPADALKQAHDTAERLEAHGIAREVADTRAALATMSG